MYDKGNGSENKSLWQLVAHPISILLLGSILVAFLVVRQKDLKEKGNAPEQERVENHEQETTESPEQEIVESHEQEITESPEQEIVENHEQEEEETKKTNTEEAEVTQRKYIPVQTDDKYAPKIGTTVGKPLPRRVKKKKK